MEQTWKCELKIVHYMKMETICHNLLHIFQLVTSDFCTFANFLYFCNCQMLGYKNHNVLHHRSLLWIFVLLPHFQLPYFQLVEVLLAQIHSRTIKERVQSKVLLEIVKLKIVVIPKSIMGFHWHWVLSKRFLYLYMGNHSHFDLAT